MTAGRIFGGLAVVVVGVVASVVMPQAAAIAPARDGCEWRTEVLPLPTGAAFGQVSAGGGQYLAGVVGGGGPRQAVRWRDGHVDVLGAAFGLDTTVHAVNPDGVVVGAVTGADRRQHAVRHRGGRFESLPEAGGFSAALDVNARGDVVGYDGVRLVVWAATGAVRVLPLPSGEAPYGGAAIDDDGTVMASAGLVAAGALRWHTYRWAPDGTRTGLPAGDVRDLRNGHAVGATAGDAPIAVRWGGRTSLLGGRVAVAVNDAGLAAGTSIDGTPLLWAGRALPVALPTPQEHHPGAVTALSADAAGGFAYPDDADGAVPLRWRCH